MKKQGQNQYYSQNCQKVKQTQNNRSNTSISVKFDLQIESLNTSITPSTLCFNAEAA